MQKFYSCFAYLGRCKTFKNLPGGFLSSSIGTLLFDRFLKSIIHKLLKSLRDPLSYFNTETIFVTFGREPQQINK